MIDYLPLPEALTQRLHDWPLDLVNKRLTPDHHGDFAKWAHAISSLPACGKVPIRAGDTVRLDISADADKLEQALQYLHPWRKGPFQFGSVHIDSEWRSDWKWQRLAPHINLNGHAVLDIGCGNGYFGWRMLAHGARSVIGVDRTVLFCMQHLAVQAYAQDPEHWVLPIGIEEIPGKALFDTVLSMGVIYHQRDPAEHVRHMKALTHPDGQVVLESLVTDARTGFQPDSRYARMHNVWWIPSVSDLTHWLKRAGFRDIRVLDVTPTRVAEQRTTPWMRFESLREALDPANPDKTIEGYPAPARAMLMARP